MDRMDHIVHKPTSFVRRFAVGHAKRDTVKELTSVVQDAAKELSENVVKALVAHPDAVVSALAVAGNALVGKDLDKPEIELVGGEPSLLIDEAEAERRLAARVRPGKREKLLTSDELAKLAELKSRQTVHNWLRKGRIIGWQSAKRGYVFPAGQFDSRGRPLEGLGRVAPHFDDSYSAWLWLTTPSPALGGATPLSRLHKGQIDEVEAAAVGYGQGDFA